MSLDEAFGQFLPQIEDDLQQVVRIPHHSLAPYYGMMRYHLGWVDEESAPDPGQKRQAPAPDAMPAGLRRRPAAIHNSACPRPLPWNWSTTFPWSTTTSRTAATSGVAGAPCGTSGERPTASTSATVCSCWPGWPCTA